jgi:3-oxoacyl-[acyl-carrier-protein] synthase-3
VRNARISGTGGYVPPAVVSNEDLSRVYGINTSDAWIRRRTGVEQRRYAAEGVGTAELAQVAAEEALRDAGLVAEQLDLIVLCTLSPERAFPGVGVDLQARLGLPERGRFVPCLDVRNQCSGFLYGLSHAVAVVRAGMAERVLVVGAEVHSAGLDLSTRGRAVSSIFGDGAGAVVVTACAERRGVRALQLGADGRFADDLAQRVWDMRRRPFVRLDEQGRGVVPPEELWASMNGPLVFRHAVDRMCEVLEQVCRAEGLRVDALDLVFFHQANLRINQLVQQQLGIAPERAPSNIERYGNTTAATIPLLLAETARDGRLREGMTVAMVAFGSGFTWGAAIVDW